MRSVLTFRRRALSPATSLRKSLPINFLVGHIMQIRLLAASSSLIGRLWYRNELERYGCQVHTAFNEHSCIELAAAIRPHILILESFPIWGRNDRILTFQDLEAGLNSMPVILIDVRRDSCSLTFDASQPDRVRACELAGAYWKWSRTAEELVQIVHLALGRSRARCKPAMPSKVVSLNHALDEQPHRPDFQRRFALSIDSQ